MTQTDEPMLPPDQGAGHSTSSEKQASALSSVGPILSKDGLQSVDVATEMVCPRCNVDLRGGKLDEFAVAFCPECHGVLIDHEGIASLLGIRRSTYQGSDRTPKPFDPQALEVQGNCPNCGEQMEVYPYCGPGNVVLDGCRGCAMVWLDNGEISAIVQAPGLRRL